MTFYYCIQVLGQPNVEEAPYFSLLRSQGVHLEVVHADNYFEGYEKILLFIKNNITEYPHLLISPRSCADDIMSPCRGADHQRARTKSPQLALRFTRN